jgi:hypothetical protein
MAAGLVGLLPASSQATLCFKTQLGSIVQMEVLGPAGGFFALMGDLKSPPGLGELSAPFSGTAHLRPDGFVHFGVQIHSAVQQPPPLIVEPFTLEGTLNPPAFTSGTATAFFPSGVVSPVPLTLSPSPCPAPPSDCITGQRAPNFSTTCSLNIP